MDTKIATREFIDVDILLKARQSLQIIKNQFFASKIGTVFQPNVINEKLHVGLGVDTLLNEVESNVAQSYEFSKEIYVYIFSIFGTWFILKEIINEFELSQWWYLSYPILIGLFFTYKDKIKKMISYFLKLVK